MSDRKEVKVSPIYLKYSNKKQKKNNASKKKQQIINVNNKSVKELLLKKLKEYKKNKTKKNDTVPNNSKINPTFLEKIKKHKQKIQNNINNSFDNSSLTNSNNLTNNNFINDNNNLTNNNFTNSNHFTNNNLTNNNFTNSNHFTNNNLTNNNLTNNNLTNNNLINNNNNLSNNNQHQSLFNLNQKPYYSNLKNGSLPTYKELKNQNTQCHNIEIEKKYILGKNKTQKKIGILLKSNKNHQKNKDYNFNLKKTNLKTVKNYLKSKNLIKYGSNAPSELLREIFENSNLCGHIKNINGKQILHNYNIT